MPRGYIYEWFGLQIVMWYFAAAFMKKNKRVYNRLQLVSAVFMILALLWLTVSIPFVNAAQQDLAKQNQTEQVGNMMAGNEEETANPFGNTTEEKAPSNSSSFSEEYLHDHHHTDHYFSIARQYHKCDNAGTYIAFHGELHVPPPNMA
ncbi:MAG: hypothetical protein JNK14_19740 [Chitinophagaceae bacterium]|nr:hypothetical protein [Chitinophagaceae bacterium]